MSIDLVRKSVDVIRTNQASSGAYVASPNFPVYNYSWLRDGAFIAYGMDRAGEYSSALAFHRWVDRTVSSLGHKVESLVRKWEAGKPIGAEEWLHCRYTLDGREGEEDWGHFQLDGYGAWLWSLAEHIRLTGNTALVGEMKDSVDLVVRYLTTFWSLPNYDSWEENGDKVHPSTLACLYGGLKAIGLLRPDLDVAEVCTLIKQNVLHNFRHQGRLTKFADGTSVDANLLWVATPFRLLEPDDPIMRATVAELEQRCLTGGLHRYPEDTYYGGGEWLLLTAWLGWYYLEIGQPDRARAMLAWVEAQADSDGHMTEQVSDRANVPGMIQHWVDTWGPVAKPLLWSHAMFLVLRAEIDSAVMA